MVAVQQVQAASLAALFGKVIKFKLDGLTPLLMNSPRGMKRKEKEAPGVKDPILSAEDEAEGKAYRLPNGDLCVPSTAVRNAILTGTRGHTWKPGGSGRPVSVMPYVSGAILLMDPFFPIVDPDGEPVTEYEVDVQRVNVQKQGILRARPRIDPPWSIIGTFAYNSEIVPSEYIRPALEQAGRIVGLLDYRMEKKGSYGAFVVAEFVEEEV